MVKEEEGKGGGGEGEGRDGISMVAPAGGTGEHSFWWMRGLVKVTATLEVNVCALVVLAVSSSSLSVVRFVQVDSAASDPRGRLCVCHESPGCLLREHEDWRLSHRHQVAQTPGSTDTR